MHLTKNFQLYEFLSPDGVEPTPEQLRNIKELAQQLQEIRNYIGKPIHITSAFRSEHYNDVVLVKKGYKPSKNSQHKLGKAADLVVKSMHPKELRRHILDLIKVGAIKQGGVGLYNGMVHYDTRGRRARWNSSRYWVLRND